MNRSSTRRRAPVFLALHSLCAAVAGFVSFTLAACASDQQETVTSLDQALMPPAAAPGRKLFEEPFPHTNGRACATCHVLSEDTTLLPSSVAARLRDHRDDPLFARIDADDPEAPEPSFEHLKKGLVRVVLPLPDNMDVIDIQGNVITAADRRIFVWRGVPSVANVALSGPFQLDGREPTLPHQAQSAILSHSEGGNVSVHTLERIAEFQRGIFSSPRARFVSQRLESGVAVEQVPVPEDFVRFSAQEQRGRDVYKAACQGCHGGATTDRIVDRELANSLFAALTPEGNVRFEVKPGQAPEPVRIARPGVEFLNAGFGAATYFGQLGLAPAFNASVALPRYRFRFYRDGTRSEAVVDLPPVPVTVSGDPTDPRAARDQNGAPIVGPNLIPQLFTTDPGRAAISGDPADFEAFDMPQLRGIARTAPYFHDNSAETLRDVVDEYSRFLLPFLKPLALPIHPPEQPGGRKEALSPEQKNDLLMFLKRL